MLRMSKVALGTCVCKEAPFIPHCAHAILRDQARAARPTLPFSCCLPTGRMQAHASTDLWCMPDIMVHRCPKRACSTRFLTATGGVGRSNLGEAHAGSGHVACEHPGACSPTGVT